MSTIEILEDILEGLKAIENGELSDFQIKAELHKAAQRLPQVRDKIIYKLAVMEYEATIYGGENENLAKNN